MTARVWVCSLGSSKIVERIGLRHKYRGEPWEQPYPNDIVPPGRKVDGQSLAGMYEQGYTVPPEFFPEASAYYKKKRIPKAQPISIAGFPYIVNEKLANILKNFDIGPGGMAPYPIYEGDEKTPVKEKWWILGFGAQKNTILPEKCKRIRKVVDGRGVYPNLYRAWTERIDDGLTFSKDALGGADLWAERDLLGSLVMSDALGTKIIEAGMGDIFEIRSAIVAD